MSVWLLRSLLISIFIVTSYASVKAKAIDAAATKIAALDDVVWVSPIHAPDRLFVAIKNRNDASKVGTLACQHIRHVGVKTPYHILLLDGSQTTQDQAGLPADWKIWAQAICPARFTIPETSKPGP